MGTTEEQWLARAGSAAESLARHQSRIHRPRRTAVQDRRTRRRSCPTLMMMMTGWDLHPIETLVRCLGMLISHTQGAILHFSADDEEDSTQAGTGPQGGAPSVPIVPPPRAHRQLPLGSIVWGLGACAPAELPSTCDDDASDGEPDDGVMCRFLLLRGI